MDRLKVSCLELAGFQNVIHGEHTDMTLFLKKIKKFLKQCAKSNDY